MTGNNLYMRRIVSRQEYHRSLLDSNKTYSYSDSEVKRIYRSGLAIGALMGALLTAAIMTYFGG